MFSWRSPSSDRKVLGREAAFASGQQVGLDRNFRRELVVLSSALTTGWIYSSISLSLILRHACK